MVTDDEGEDDSFSADGSSREHPGQSVICVKKKMGRPRKLELNERTLGRIEGMAAVGCTIEEIASTLNVDKKTFFKFMDDHPEARQAREYGGAVCRMSLRRAQFRHAKTSWPAASYLGRIYLADQREAYFEERRAARAKDKPPEYEVEVVVTDNPEHKPGYSPQRGALWRGWPA